jgi:putative RNA 2'-phosphotransferase
MGPGERRKLSKLMSLVLRHRPEALGLTLDERGFCAVDALVRAASEALGREVTRAEVEALAGPPASPEQKVRFELEGDFVRAGHGHSIPIAGYRAASPRPPLYHATVRAALPSIRAEGLRAMARQKVHLSTDRSITLEAARRRSRDTVLIEVDLEAARRAGVGFYESADPRIVLSDDLPPEVLRILDLED